MKKLHGAVDWLGRWWKIGLTVVGAILAFGSGFWAFLVEDDPTRRVVLFVVGLIGTLLAVIMPIWETKASHQRIADLESDLATAELKETQAVEDAKRDGREEFLLVVDFVIRPLLEKLGSLVRSRTAPTKSLLATQLKVLALSAIKEVIDPSIPRLRANYFKLRYPECDQGPYLQEPVSTAMAPRDYFDLGNKSAESKAILQMLAEADYVFTPDCVEQPPPGFDTTKKRAYRTFISAAAYDGTDVDGMLSVDSPEAGSLTDADATVVQLVATIIAISEAVRDGKKDDAEP